MLGPGVREKGHFRLLSKQRDNDKMPLAAGTLHSAAALGAAEREHGRHPAPGSGPRPGSVRHGGGRETL